MPKKPRVIITNPTKQLDEFTLAYCTAMLWSSTDESDPNTGGDPLDKNWGIIDIHPETMASIIADCKAFQEAHGDDFNSNYEQAGHDYWLTRNHHGTGFWARTDDVYSQEQQDRLTAAAHAAGGRDPYVYRRKIRID